MNVPIISWPQAILIGVIAGTLAGLAAYVAESRKPCNCAEAAPVVEPAATPKEAPDGQAG